jgi:glycosyltransferase involved in cell wall biosynthesis
MLVTVVTPSLNGMKWLAKCIDSVQAQVTSNVEVEHVFVDGGSTDGTPEYAASRGCTVMAREEPSIYFAINKGSRNSSGELLGMLGCDDILLPGALDAVVRQYRRDGRRWLLGGCLWMLEDGRSLGGLRAPPSWMSARTLACLGWSLFPSAYMNRDMFLELGGYRSDFHYAGDYEFCIRALLHEPFSRIRRPLHASGRHSGNLSKEINAQHLAELAAVIEMAGPSSAWQRRSNRYFLKLWVNAANPTWSVRKRIGAVGARRVTKTTSRDGQLTD